MHRRLVVVACLPAVLCILDAQAPQQPIFRTGVEVVAVDVRVIDRAGRPVVDLRPEDFVVTVNGTPRALVTADFVSYPVTSGGARAASVSEPAVLTPLFSSNEVLPARGRTVVIVVDEENIRSGYGKWAADAAGRFVDRMLPDDRVGLYIPRSRINIAPTTEHAAVKAALSHVVGHMAEAMLGSRMGLASACDMVYGPLVKEGGWDPSRSAPSAAAKGIVDDMRQRTLDSLRSLAALLDSLGTEPGPKTIVLVSEEMPVCDHIAERAERNYEFARLGEAAARAQAMLYVLQLDRPLADAEDPQRAGQNQQAQSSRDRDLRSFGLETVVSVTGGSRLMVSGRPDAPLERVALEISGQYLLGFRSEPADRDGKAHPIKVTVKRKGVNVYARQMFAYAGDAVPAAGTSAVDAVNRLLRANSVSKSIPLSVATYALLDPGSRAGQLRVLISAEIDRAVASDTAMAIGYAITDATGRNAGASVEEATLKRAQGDPEGRLCYVGAAVVQPGRYTLRVAAASSAERTGSVLHTFDARVSNAGEFSLSDLVVFDRYPATAGSPRPSVSATVAGELSCYLEAYTMQQPADRPTGLAVRLELADAPDAPPRVTGRMIATGADDDGRLPFSGSVALNDVPPGNYVARAVLVSAGNTLGRVVRPVRVVIANTR